MALQARVGWRAYVATAPLVSASTLLTSLYSVWNGDTLGTSLDTSIRAAYNAENNANDALGTYNGTSGGSLIYSTGKIGNAFDFNGTNAYVELPSNTLSLSTNFAFSFWMYTRANGNTTVISNFGNDGINRGFYIDQDGTNALRFVAFNNTSAIVTTGTAAIQLNQWQHFVFNCNAGVGQWYLNGSSIGSPTNISPTYISNSKPLICAFRSGNAGGLYAYRNMKIDALTIWNKALTADEVTQLYNTGTGAEYPFSSQTLPSAKDAYGTNNGTLVNGTTFTTGKIGKAFRFDGVNDYVSLPNTSGEFNFNGNFTVSTWFRSSNLSASRYFMSNYQNNGSTWGYGWSFYYSSSLGFTFQLDNGAVTNRVNFQSGYGANIWYHVVVVRTMGQKHKIYVNGVDTPAVQSSGNASTTAGYIANQKMDLGGISSLNLSALCDLDGVSMWTKALTASEVTELYNSGNGKQYPNF